MGGGSIVNQALLDRFDDIALDSWKEQSKVSFFNQKDLAPWYDKVEKDLVIQEIPANFRNGNAHIFADGFKACGFTCAPLKRGQKDCRFEDGNDCIECLSGCPIDSKQSTPVTTLRKALKLGAQLISEFEVAQIKYSNDKQIIGGKYKGQQYLFSAKKVIMASGAIGNSKLLLKNEFHKTLPALGHHFYTHPQFMILGLYDKKIDCFSLR